MTPTPNNITHLKNAVVFAATLVNSIYEKLEDGKLKFFEGLQLALQLSQVNEIIKNAALIKAEYQDLDESERLQLVDAVKDELNLPNEKAERITEYSFELLTLISSMAQEFKK